MKLNKRILFKRAVEGLAVVLGILALYLAYRATTISYPSDSAWEQEISITIENDSIITRLQRDIGNLSQQIEKLQTDTLVVRVVYSLSGLDGNDEYHIIERRGIIGN